MTITYILLFYLIFACHSIEYKNICFDIKESNGEKVNIMVNKKLPFFPKIIQLDTLVISGSYGPGTESKKETTKNLKKSDGDCNNPLYFGIPQTMHPFKIVKFSFICETKRFVLEEFKTVIKSNFNENVFELKGLREIAKINVIFMYSPHYDNRSSTRLNLYFFKHTIVRNLRRREFYCLSFFTLEFSNLMAIKFKKSFSGKIKKYQILKIHFYTYDYNIYIEPKSYLVKLVPCYHSEFLRNKLQILADPRMTKLEIELEESDISPYVTNKYKIKFDALFLDKKKSELFIPDLEVIFMPLTQKMVDSKEYMLEYPYKKEIIICPLRLPEDFDSTELSYVEVKRFGNVVLSKIGYYADMSTQEFNVFNIKPSQPSQNEICTPA